VVAEAVLALALTTAPPALAPPPSPRLDDVLALAGRYVARLEEELAVLVADETYAQALLVGRDGPPRQQRSLVSEVAWVPTGDAMVWAFFRDVREVDGASVGDREARLLDLFPAGMTPAGNARALEILEESSRYNLGRHRTINSPTIALSFLHPRNQRRFSFRLVGPDERGRVPTWKLAFGEKDRPTLTRTWRGEDVPARGLLWIESGGFAVVASRLEMKSPRGIGPIAIDTDYARDERLGAWLPTQMQETYGERPRSERDERVEAVARYSGWRRARVEVQPIVPVR
jgi:hypothetical protein